MYVKTIVSMDCNFTAVSLKCVFCSIPSLQCARVDKEKSSLNVTVLHIHI